MGLLGNFQNRNFTIINADGTELNFCDQDNFGYSPSGLGVETNNTFYSASGTYYIYETEVKQNSLSFDMAFGFESGHPYVAFYNMLEILNRPPLQMRYDIPDIGSFWRDITVNSISKSDAAPDNGGLLIETLKFDCETAWYQWKSINDLENFENPSPKVWINTNTMENLFTDNYMFDSTWGPINAPDNDIYGFNPFEVNNVTVSKGSTYIVVMNLKLSKTSSDFAALFTGSNKTILLVDHTDNINVKYINPTTQSCKNIGSTVLDDGSIGVTYQIEAEYALNDGSVTTVVPYALYTKPMAQYNNLIIGFPQFVGMFKKDNTTDDDYNQINNGEYVYDYVYSPDYGGTKDYVEIENDSLYLGLKNDSSCIIGVRPKDAPIVNPSWSLVDKNNNILLTTSINTTIPVGYTLQVISDDFNKSVILSSPGNPDEDITLDIDITKTGFIRIPIGVYRIKWGEGIDTTNAYVQFKKEWLIV